MTLNSDDHLGSRIEVRLKSGSIVSCANYGLQGLDKSRQARELVVTGPIFSFTISSRREHSQLGIDIQVSDFPNAKYEMLGAFYPDDPADWVQISVGDTIHAVLLVANRDELYHSFLYLAISRGQRYWTRVGVITATPPLMHGRSLDFQIYKDAFASLPSETIMIA